MITELSIDNQQALEIVCNAQFLGHTHAPVQLHSIFANEDAILTDKVFQRMDRALGSIALLHDFERGAVEPVDLRGNRIEARVRLGGGTVAAGDGSCSCC